MRFSWIPVSPTARWNESDADARRSALALAIMRRRAPRAQDFLHKNHDGEAASMADWRDILLQTAQDIENEFDRLRYRLHSALGGPDPIKIVPYRGFGNHERVFLRGRVLEDRGDLSAKDNDSIWTNLLNAYRRLESDEIPRARLRARFSAQESEVQADDEGYFEVSFHRAEQALSANQAERRSPDGRMWYPLEIELLSPQSPRQTQPVRAVGEVLVPPATARFAIVSDIDDTVIDLGTRHLLRLARAVFLGNARTRIAFPGMAAFLRALHAGADGRERNPLFFISSGPWNLYDLLLEFFRLRGVPAPVLFLGDWGLGPGPLLPFQVREHKLAMLELLIAFYPGLPFLLIGDSTQKDPEIYLEFAKNHSGSVLAIFLRDVDPDARGGEKLRALEAEAASRNIRLVRAGNTLAMAEEAAARGWIASGHLAGIRDDKRADEREERGHAEEPQDEPDSTDAARDRAGRTHSAEDSRRASGFSSEEERG